MSDFNRLHYIFEMLQVKKRRYREYVLKGNKVSVIFSRHIEMLQGFLKEAPESMDPFIKWAMVDQSGRWIKERIKELEIARERREERARIRSLKIQHQRAEKESEPGKSKKADEINEKAQKAHKEK